MLVPLCARATTRLCGGACHDDLHLKRSCRRGPTLLDGRECCVVQGERRVLRYLSGNDQLAPQMPTEQVR